MNIKKLLFLTVFSLNFQSTLAVCAEETIDYLTHPKRLESAAGGLYAGTFEDGTPFMMSLPTIKTNPKTNKNAWSSTLPAHYWYPRKFSGKSISLGLQSVTGNTYQMTVTHYDEKSNHILVDETFDLALSADQSNGKGEWARAKPSKQMSFTLHKVVEYKQISVSLPYQYEEQTPSNKTFEFSAVFPVFGDSRDQWVKKLAASCDFDRECTNTITAVWYSPSLMTLYASVWGFGDGAAHGNGYSQFQHYDTSGAKPKPVQLDFFINTSANCINSLSEKAIALLDKQGLSSPEHGAIDNWKKRVNYLVAPTGIVFNFDPYEVGTYAEGAPSVFIDKAKIGKCLKQLPSYP